MPCQGNARVLPSTKIMPGTKECPLCAGTMRLRETKTVTHIPGNPKDSERTSREWVCPDCDYFEEADEENSR